MSNKHSIHSIVAQVGLLIVIAAAGAWVVAAMWPYEDLTISPAEDIPILNSDSDGVVTDDFIQYGVDYCNNDVDVISTRWFDIYNEFSVFSSEGDKVGAISLPTQEFNPPDEQCGTAIVKVQIPFYVPRDGTVYKFRSINEYKPNPLRTVEVEYTTEQFTLGEKEEL